MTRTRGSSIAGRMMPAVLLFALVLLPGDASAGLKWENGTVPVLRAMSTESESDTSLVAICKSRVSVELHLGANEGVGNGKGEKVTLRLQGDGRTATVQGQSRQSENFEMTGGTELVTHVTADDDLFKVLGSGKATRVEGSVKKPFVWNDAGMAAAVRKFLAACR